MRRRIHGDSLAAVTFSTTKRLRGLVAATFTPFDARGEVDLDRVPALVEHALRQGIAGLYVCGSTGQGLSLSSDERRRVTEAFVAAAAGRLPVIVQVGHESVVEARGLAAHAAACGADAISALAPVYFKPRTPDALLATLEEIASAAPDSPFYYYFIPELSGVAHSPLDLLARGAERLPSLAGVKYTAPTLDELQEGLAIAGDRFQLLFGRDEMLLAALSVGVEAAVGSTYNYLAPVYRRLIAAFEAGDLVAARAEQAKSLAVIRLLRRFGVDAQKPLMAELALDCGPARLPLRPLAAGDLAELRRTLDELGARAWARGEEA